tara:strand:- start:6651 stop:6887 length:237 start_codon:yes stop_codon:yes gene_type:complete
MDKYVLFIIDECTFCSQAVLLLEKESKSYKVVDLTDTLSTRAQIKMALNWTTFPIILSRDGKDLKLVGGYTELKEVIG